MRVVKKLDLRLLATRISNDILYLGKIKSVPRNRWIYAFATRYFYIIISFLL